MNPRAPRKTVKPEAEPATTPGSTPIVEHIKPLPQVDALTSTAFWKAAAKFQRLR